MNALYNGVGELLSPYRSVKLPLNFGAPALEETAVLDSLSTLLCVTLRCRLSGRGETAVVNTERRAVCREQSLTSFHASCRKLVSRGTKIYRVVILSIFLTPFYITPYSDSVLCVFIIRQGFKTE